MWSCGAIARIKKPRISDVAAPVGATATGSGAAATTNHGKIRGLWEGKGKEEEFSGGGAWVQGSVKMQLF